LDQGQALNVGGGKDGGGCGDEIILFHPHLNRLVLEDGPVEEHNQDAEIEGDGDEDENQGGNEERAPIFKRVNKGTIGGKIIDCKEQAQHDGIVRVRVPPAEEKVEEQHANKGEG